MRFPKRIEELINGLPYTENQTGMSDSRVLCFDTMVLKVEREWEESRNAAAMLGFLAGKLPVPRILAEETWEGEHYLLMTRMPGKMSCDETYLEDPPRLTKLLAQALRMLWAVDISDCPRDQSLDRKLRQAAYRVENGLVDLDNVEPGTFGEGGFRDPAELLQWLRDNRPAEDRVLSHGDFCLPNVFLDEDQVGGFVDLGRSGAADRYQDIALCCRSLCHNFDGTYGGKVYLGFEPTMLFRELGFEPDWEKIRYYILLDELF